MALKSELMAGGLPATLANKLGFDPVTTYAAAGTTQATATSLTANASIVNSVALNSGVIIARGNEWNFVANTGGNVLTVYPPVGSKFAGLSTNAGITLAPGKTVLICGDGTTLFYNLSA